MHAGGATVLRVGAVATGQPQREKDLNELHLDAIAERVSKIQMVCVQVRAIRNLSNRLEKVSICCAVIKSQSEYIYIVKKSAAVSLHFLQKNQNMLNKIEPAGDGQHRDALISAG